MSEHLDDTTGYQTVEVTCQRAIGNGQFASGVQDFNFSVAHPNVWSPADSYFVVEVELLGKGDPTTAGQPKISDGVAFAEGVCNNLYSNAYVYAGGQALSSIVQYLPQAAALHRRTSYTWAHASSVGPGAFATGASFADRCLAVSSTTNGSSAPFGDAPTQLLRPCDPGAFATATVQIEAANQEVVLGVGTAFSAELAGSIIVINGTPYQIFVVNSPTSVTIGPYKQVEPAVIVATTEWYIIRRDVDRTTQGKNRIQLLWKPPLGIFNTDALMGPGSYKISLSPDSSYRLAAVETLNPDAKSGVGATSAYTINVLDVRFYAGMAQKAMPDGPQPPLHLMEYSVFSKTIQSTQGSFNFTVPPSTEELYVFLQAGSSGQDPVFPPNKFVAVNDSDLNLRSIQMTYAGQTKPQTRWSSGITVNDPAGRNSEYIAHLYYQGLLETGRANDQGGAESLDEFLQRGAFYSFRFDKDASSRETEVQLQIGYANVELTRPFDVTSKVFLVAKHRSVRQITISNGAIVQVVGIDA